MKNAPATFQAIMYVVLGKYIGSKVVVYMDDVVSFSKEEKEHQGGVEEVIRR